MPMPGRLIQFIVLFAIFLLFAIFNLENRCDISFGFVKFSDVPVFITAFLSLMVGMLCALPFIISGKMRKPPKTGKGEGKPGGGPAKKPPQQDTGAGQADNLTDNKYYGID